MTIRFVAAAAAIVFGVATVAAPALAAPRTVPAPTVEAPAEPAPASEATRKAASPTTRYCSEAKFTGSLITKRVCHTRDEWLATGVDPLDYLPR